MYVKTFTNDREIMAIVDMSATHNFVAENVVAKLGLKLTQHCSQLKAVNSKSNPSKL